MGGHGAPSAHAGRRHRCVAPRQLVKYQGMVRRGPSRDQKGGRRASLWAPALRHHAAPVCPRRGAVSPSLYVGWSAVCSCGTGAGLRRKLYVALVLGIPPEAAEQDERGGRPRCDECDDRWRAPACVKDATHKRRPLISPLASTLPWKVAFPQIVSATEVEPLLPSVVWPVTTRLRRMAFLVDLPAAIRVSAGGL